MNGLNRSCGKKYGNHENIMHATPYGAPLPYPVENFPYHEDIYTPTPEMPGGMMPGMPGGMPGGMMPGGMPGGMMPGGMHCGMPVTRVVEPPVHCPPNVFHHWQKVEHIVPVCVKNIHHCHTKHDYIVCKEEKNETCYHTHGLECDKDFCALAQQIQPRPCC